MRNFLTSRKAQLVNLKRTSSLEDTGILCTFKFRSVTNTRPFPLPELGFYTVWVGGKDITVLMVS